MKWAGVLGFGLVATVASATGTRSPVEAVVKLLENLEEKIEQDHEVEQKTYDKYACWCEKTTDRKATAIDKAHLQLRLLGQAILSLKGKVATLESEISEANQEIAANQELQAEATALREKQNTAWQSSTSQIKQTLAALEKAIQVLVEGSSASLLQRAATARGAIQTVLEVMPGVSSLGPEHLSLLGEFASGRSTADYAPQSATIQGILKDMYDTFSNDLESATGLEASRNAQFEAFIHEKVVQVNVLEVLVARKEAEKSEAEQLLAETVQDYDSTEAQRKADIGFFDETKAACITKHDEWVSREALRAEELGSVKKTLEILTSDKARALFAAADKPGISLLQVESVDSASMPSVRAYAALKAQASKSHSLRLAALAVRVRQAKVGHFAEVIKAIDDMVATLEAEDVADIAKRDQCKEEYQSVASKSAHVTWLIQKNDAKIHKLEDLIGLKNGERDNTISEIQDVTQQIAQLEAQRAAEHAAFLKAKEDDLQAIALLGEALAAFTAYYEHHNVDLGVLQKKQQMKKQPEFAVSADQAPEAVFTSHDEHKHESKGIAQFLENIVEDLHAELRAEIKSEEDSQADFDKQHAAAEQLKSDLLSKKAVLEEAIAQREQEKSDEHAEKLGNEADLKDEQDYLAKIKPDCDWILGAFEERAGRRVAELKGLAGAKEYLAGAAQASFLEKGHSFDDSVLPKLGFLGIKQ